MKLILGVLATMLATTPLASAQTDDDVLISVAGFELAANGAEKPAGVSRVIGTRPIGQPTLGVFSAFGCGYFSLTVPPNSFHEDATVGWRVEITPLKLVDHAVTFRLRWTRALDKGSGVSPIGEDVELTLRPGESRPLDSVPVPTNAKAFNNRPCETKSVSLRVSVDLPDFDRRLIAANVWLVERLPNGKEQSQLQSVRGLPHRPIPFYFDGLPDGAKRLDIFGKLVAELEAGTIEIALETVGAVANPVPPGYQSARWFRSTVRMKPNEIVEVTLRQPDDEASEFARRVFSLRIQAKQLR